MTPCLKRLIWKKQRFYNKGKRTKTASDWSQFKNIQQQVRQLQCNKYLSNILNSTSKLKENQPFWNSQNCDDTGISVPETPDGIATTPTSKAEILNSTFQSVFTVEDKTSLPESTHPSIEEITITEPDVFALLSQIDPHKAGRPDKIPARILKELAVQLTPMLTHLFKQSISTSDIPQEWKTAFVTPIFKKGKRNDPSNCCPMSLTSIVCKTLEHILVSQIMKHLE